MKEYETYLTVCTKKYLVGGTGGGSNFRFTWFIGDV